MSEFDVSSLNPSPPFTRNLIYKMQVDRFIGKESDVDSKLRTLRQLKLTCYACSMCPLGLRDAVENNTGRDPHVFSTMYPAKYMVVGDQPTYNDLKDSYPHSLVDQFRKHTNNIGLFYFTNLTKCHNSVGDKVDSAACLNILNLEIAIVRPKLLLLFPQAMALVGDHIHIPTAGITCDGDIRLVCGHLD